MPLQAAKRVNGGAYLDLRELADDGPVLAIFHIVEYCDPEPAQGDGWVGINVPVVADVIIASGPREGELHRGERFFTAITATLRGVPNPRKDKGIPVLEPAYQLPQGPDDDPVVLVARLKVVGNKVFADDPSPAELKAADAVYQAMGGDDLWRDDQDDDEPPARPVSTGAGPKRKPWKG